MEGVQSSHAGNTDYAAHNAQGDTDDAVDRAVQAIERSLSQSWRDWDVSSGDLREIKNTLDALTPQQTNAAISQLSDQTLATLGSELDGMLGNLSATERADLFNNTATDVSGPQIARVFNGLSADHQHELANALNTYGTLETRAAFVDTLQRQALGATAADGALSAEQRALLLDLGQLALDIVGLADPTPVSDGANGLISLFRGDFLGAGLSAVSMIPYLGDAAKLGKLGKWAETVAGVVELAARNADFARAAEPILRQIANAVDAIPDGVMRNLPDSAQDTLRNISRQVDEVLSGAARSADAPLVLNSSVGNTAVVNGRTVTIGDAPAVRPNSNGQNVVIGVDGAENTIRQPRSYDSATELADGSVVYTKNNQSVTYDANGFPVFNARADVYLEPQHIGSGSDAGHFRAANEAMRDALRNDPGLADRLGLNESQVQHLLSDTVSSRPPPDMTWHHHQDTGRMQLVDRAEHNLFRGGHVGGMAIWGGGR